MTNINSAIVNAATGEAPSEAELQQVRDIVNDPTQFDHFWAYSVQEDIAEVQRQIGLPIPVSVKVGAIGTIAGLEYEAGEDVLAKVTSCIKSAIEAEAKAASQHVVSYQQRQGVLLGIEQAAISFATIHEVITPEWNTEEWRAEVGCGEGWRDVILGVDPSLPVN